MNIPEISFQLTYDFSSTNKQVVGPHYTLMSMTSPKINPPNITLGANPHVQIKYYSQKII